MYGRCQIETGRKGGDVKKDGPLPQEVAEILRDILSAKVPFEKCRI